MTIYAKEGNAGVKKVIQSLSKIDAENRIICLERNIHGMIPITNSTVFSPEEAKSMRIKIDNFYRIHPVGEIPTNLGFNINNQDSNKIMEKISWYLKEEERSNYKNIARFTTQKMSR
ncbi:MAG: hypothetical protein WCF23_23395 [Candidatus Nitrosopolaris sp.]